MVFRVKVKQTGAPTPISGNEIDDLRVVVLDTKAIVNLGLSILFCITYSKKVLSS